MSCNENKSLTLIAKIMQTLFQIRRQDVFTIIPNSKVTSNSGKCMTTEKTKKNTKRVGLSIKLLITLIIKPGPIQQLISLVDSRYSKCLQEYKTRKQHNKSQQTFSSLLSHNRSVQNEEGQEIQYMLKKNLSIKEASAMIAVNHLNFAVRLK